MDKARLLVVDDDILIRTHIEEVLPESGFVVECVETGAQAIDLIRHRSFDAVLLDLLLPGENGLDILQQIRALPDPPEVVLLTAHSSVESAVEAMKLGAADYIEKPYRVNQLETLLRRICEVRRLSSQVTALSRVAKLRPTPPLVAHSPQMAALIRVIQKVAPTDSTILIQGETGAGKELVANELYQLSRRSNKPFIPINCGALNEQLLESELFGHEKGSFTGASAVRNGLFEIADGGTIFLDEIGEIPLPIQVKLLRVLQSGEIRRVGGNRVITVDVRVIASTNKNLADATRSGVFRDDLFYRLSVITIHVPPLRERKQEIPHLVNHFLQQAAVHSRTTPKSISEEAMAVLLRHDWPGNVRELENVIELAVVLSDEPIIQPRDLPAHLFTVPQAASSNPVSLEEVEYQHLLKVLNQNNGNKRKTARDLGIDAKTLYSKLRRKEQP